ncbi:MAG: cytochrome P450 [Actinobacteria bacterium]|nr:cytochrome P450 [Actinomycetota bacterium]
MTDLSTIDRTQTIPPWAWFVAPPLFADMHAWHDAVDEIRQATPILSAEPPGYSPMWILTRHADVFAVSRDHQTWHNTTRSVLGPDIDYANMMASGMPLPKTLVHLDGDDHRDHRAVTNSWFKPKIVANRQPRIDELADEFIGRMRDLGGHCDFASDIAQPFTLRVIMDIYGVPESDEALMLELTQGIFGAADPEYLGDAADPNARVLESVMRFIQYFNDMTVDRRACPMDDIASVIANGKVNGKLMDDEHRLWYYIIIATAGHDTTSFALAGAMDALVRHPDEFAKLRADPGLVNNAADEVFRWTSPVRHFMRYAQHDTELAGVAIPEGGRVLLSYPAANRDPEVFDQPEEFRVDRPDADRILTFGVGAHFCLGIQFAKREIRTMLDRLARQLDRVELAGDVEFAQSHFVSGVKHLPIDYSFA